jgi:hypothetical protein
VQQAASERLLLQYTTSTHTLKHTGTQASTLENALHHAYNSSSLGPVWRMTRCDTRLRDRTLT